MHPAEVPHIVIGVRLVRPLGFMMMRKMILRTLENIDYATVDVVQFPTMCDIVIIEQGTTYVSAPDAFVIRLSHHEADDPYQVSMRVRRELKDYYVQRYT